MRLRILLLPSIFLLCILSVTAIRANNNTYTLTGSVGHTSAFPITGGNFVADSWIGLTDATPLGGGNFTIVGGQVNGSSEAQSAVSIQQLTTHTAPSKPLLFVIFLMLFTGVVTLGMLRTSAPNR